LTVAGCSATSAATRPVPATTAPSTTGANGSTGSTGSGAAGIGIKAFTTPLTTIVLPVGATTQPPFPEHCKGTWIYAHGVVSASVTARGPALVAVMAADERGASAESTVKLPARRSHASASMRLGGVPWVVRAAVIELGATGLPNDTDVSCSLAQTR
jgi:hypothetical protein